MNSVSLLGNNDGVIKVSASGWPVLSQMLATYDLYLIYAQKCVYLHLP